MPIYTYRCTSCGIQFDEQQKFTDAPLTRCPECSKKTLRKVFQPVGIVFKGSGFYATDHRSPSGGGSRLGKPGASGEGEKSSSSSSTTTSSEKSSSSETSSSPASPSSTTSSSSSDKE
jgi:putative FmdB family regulatory protein